MNKTIQLKTKNSLSYSKPGPHLVAIVYSALSVFLLCSIQFLSVHFNMRYNISFFYLLAIIMAFALTKNFPNNQEFLLIPVSVILLEKFIHNSSLLTLLPYLLLLAVYILSTFTDINFKYSKIMAIIYLAGNTALRVKSILPLLKDFTNPLGLLLSVSLFLADIAFVTPFLSTSHQQNTDYTKISLKKIFNTTIIIAICIAIFLLIGVIATPNSTSTPSCGHASCKENGPFPCYGKNNTCPNKTACYEDRYCDSCD